jgi:hypothetical protein
VILAAAAVVTWRWLDGEPAPAAPPTSSAPKPAVTPPTAAAPAQADLGKKPEAPKPAAEGPRLKFPDGSSMPALNGVKGDVVINWGTRPFTRVVGTEDGPNGWKWYVHENGTRSTTAMIDMNGVPQAMGLVAEPEKALPTLPELGKPPGTGTKK